jgi:tetratricopeptide (TPR) repeat protein
MRIALNSTLLTAVALSTAAAASPQIADVRELLREAGKLIPQIEKGQQSSAASNISGAQVRAGDLAGALETVRSVLIPENTDRPRPNLMDYYGISWNLAKQGNWRVAMDLLRDLPDDDAKAVDLLGMAECLAASKNFADALDVARSIKKIPGAANRFAETLVWISNKQFQAGDPTMAMATFNEALEAAEGGQPFSAKSWYPDAISRLKSAGNSAAAALLLGRLTVSVNEERDRNRNQELLHQFARSQAVMGDFASAVRTANRLTDPSQRTTALLSIASEQARQGDPAAARRLVADLPSAAWPDFALAEFANALARSGDWAGAIEAIRGIPKATTRAYAFAQLALGESHQKGGTAVVAVAMALEEARRAEDTLDPFVYQLIAVTRSNLGDFPGALQMISEFKPDQSVWPLWNVTEQLVAAGRSSEAIALAHAQEFPRARAYALLGTATSLMAQIEAANRKR